MWPSSAILSRSGIKALGVEWLGERRFSRYRFAHNLMQHYLLHNLDDVEASFLHEDVGRALEDLHGPASDTVALQLARHFDLAGLSAKAQHYLGLAGDRAMEVYANQEALAHYSRALDWATEDVDRFRLLVSRLKVHELSGHQEARRQDLEELEESAARLADPAKLAEVGLQRCKYETAVGNYAAARKAGDDAAALFKGVGDVAGEASARLALGLALYQSANYAEAREECQQALAQAREIARFDIEGGALANLGIVADLTGDRQASRSYFEQALAVYRRANFPSHEAKLLSNLGVAYWRAHDLDGALEHFQESLAKARHVGARTVEGIALSNLAMVWQSKGDLDEARRYIEQGSTVNREIGSPNAIARTLGFLASILLGQGDYPGSRAADEEALEIDRRTGDRQDESFRLAYLGRLARRLGEHEKSSSLYGDALALCREIDDRDVEALCLRGLTALHLDLGEPAKAVELANQALDLSKQLGDHEGQALAALLAGHARIALDEIDGAERAYLYAADLDIPSVAPSTAAGLAHVAVRRGDYQKAAALIEPIVNRLLSRDTSGMEEIFRLYMTAKGRPRGHQGRTRLRIGAGWAANAGRLRSTHSG
ncbi:MAG: tetratricopeptide repeat protein [Acidimicrobiia bacterium]